MRVIIKIGDIFSVKIDEKSKKYFQYIANDLAQLNSDVIRAFHKTYPIGETTRLNEIINDKVDFYAHCIVAVGVKRGLWQKEGNIPEIGNLNHILFRGTNDVAKNVDAEPVLVSDKWFVWRINDKQYTRVGKLEGENRKAEIGAVVNPYNILDRMRTGKYNFYYPGFE